jgi:polysaccharide biosynthesis protein PslF
MSARPSHRFSTASAGPRVGMLSTYPPKLCGLATFAAALEAGLRSAGSHVDVVRIDDGDDIGARSGSVVAELVNGVPSSIRNAAAVLSRCDVAIVQHEYGIFGGTDGDEVIDLLHALEIPSIVVLHTVPLRPTPNQRAVLAAIADLAHRVIVMSEAANDRLTASYPVDSSKIVTIPHGATRPIDQGGRDEPIDTRPQLLTWGLLGPGKGIEHAIDALAMLSDIGPHYTVAGVTHPKVLARRGDEYRNSLIERADRLGVADSVTFDDRYRDVAQLTRFVASASVVVLPYDSRDQVTSGVLVDAIAAGRPVIATAFPHAVELLGSGAGIVVPHEDPVALADAIRLAITGADELSSMAAEARRIAPSLGWNAVADRYIELADELLRGDDLVGAEGSVAR